MTAVVAVVVAVAVVVVAAVVAAAVVVDCLHCHQKLQSFSWGEDDAREALVGVVAAVVAVVVVAVSVVVVVVVTDFDLLKIAFPTASTSFDLAHAVAPVSTSSYAPCYNWAAANPWYTVTGSFANVSTYAYYQIQFSFAHTLSFSRSLPLSFATPPLSQQSMQQNPCRYRPSVALLLLLLLVLVLLCQLFVIS